MPIIITSKQEGFRRCGVVHTTEAKEHADDAFTEEQLAQLQADPMLLVEVQSAPAAKTQQKAKTETKPQAEEKPRAKAEEKPAAAGKPAQAKGK